MNLVGLKPFNAKEHLTSPEAISAYKEEATRQFNEDLDKFLKEAESALVVDASTFTDTLMPNGTIVRHYVDSSPLFRFAQARDIILVNDRDDPHFAVFSGNEFEDFEDFCVQHGLVHKDLCKDFEGNPVFMDIAGNAFQLVDSWEDDCCGPATSFSAVISQEELAKILDYAESNNDGGRVKICMTQSGIGYSFKVGKPGSNDLTDVTNYDNF